MWAAIQNKKLSLCYCMLGKGDYESPKRKHAATNALRWQIRIKLELHVG